MPYATSQDIVDRLPEGLEDLKVLADRDGDGTPDAEVVDGALSDGADEMDVYIGTAYDLPLPAVPAVLVRLNVDIAIYRMARDAGRATEENRKRYEDAIHLLLKIADGKVRLKDLEGDEPPAESGSSFTAQARRFQRGRMP